MATSIAAYCVSVFDPVWSTVVLIAAGLALWAAIAFNRLVKQRNLLREAWSGMDVQLRRRHDLVPNLVECVKGYSDYEKSLLERVTELRALPAEGGRKQTETGENALTDQIKRLFAVVERYPEIKANRNFLDLQDQLAEIEDQLQMARRYYNGAMRNHNTLVESFPSNMVARLFGFAREEFFQIVTTSEREAPKVDL